jgi:hypothetical protein
MTIFSIVAEYGVTIDRETALDIVLFFDENYDEIEMWKAGKTGCKALRFRQFWENDNCYGQQIDDFAEEFRAMLDLVNPDDFKRVIFDEDDNNDEFPRY